MPMRLIKWTIILFVSFSAVNCSNEAPATTQEELTAKLIDEYSINEIPLPPELADPASEISGLAWCKEDLIILPQYPMRLAVNDTSCLFGISKQSLLSYLKERKESYLDFYRIKLLHEGLDDYFQIGSGFEAIEFIGSDVYLTIEHMSEDKTQSFLVKGSFNLNEKIITLKSASLTKVEYREDIKNLSHETLTTFEGNLAAIYEANGAAIEENPQVSLFDSDLHLKAKYAFPTIEYRITDATTADSLGRFWVLNYFWPGDYKKLNPRNDYFVKEFGVGKSHKKSPIVERLVELQNTDGKIRHTGITPIYLELASGSRNWEGLVKLDNMGFILASDTFPRTILAFVAYSE